MQHTTYYDIVDEDDHPLGYTAGYEEAHSKGLWNRSTHVLIYTPDRKIVLQKRAPSLKYHPGEVEVSVGGGVDAGETPEQAAVREVQEELGISIKPGDLHFIGKSKYNHTTKIQIYRCIIYCYTICLPEEALDFKISPEEVTSAFLLSEKKLRAALRRHRIRHVGKITSTYAFWQYLLDAIPAQ